MRSKRRQHPNYKAYLSQQLRILQEKYPFLSSQQRKAKICSSWESLSPQQKDDWETAIGRRNNASGKTKDLPQISHNSEESSTCESQPEENLKENSQYICEQYHKTSPKKENKEKRVTFLEPISPMEDYTPKDFPSQKAATTTEVWPLSNEFNTIMAHKLHIEQGVGQDNRETKQQQNSWPLFGDLSTIFSTELDNDECVKKLIDEVETDEEQEDSEEKDGLMCGLFENFKCKSRSTERRLLSCLGQSEENVVTRLFEDEQFFA